MNDSSPASDLQALLSEAYDPHLLQQAGRLLVDLVSQHFRETEKALGPVLNWNPPEDNIQTAKQWLQPSDLMANCPSGSDRKARLARFEQLVRLSLQRGQNLHHPHYVGHQVPASLPLAALFDTVGSLTNQVLAIYEMGPWATAVERAVVDTLGEAIGYPRGRFGGLVTSGGSLANLTALLTARNVCLSESWATGLANQRAATSQTRHPVIVVHADAHYSVTRAAGILGLGTDQVIRVPLDSTRRMDTEQLSTILAELRATGTPVVAVVAAACATPVGAFDRLHDVADICQRHQIWLHVDAAHGGGACLSKKYRHLISGLQRADSVVCDAHKMLFIPALCAFVFYRNAAHRFLAFQQEAPYLFDPSVADMAEYDSGLVNLECTKRAAALGLWGIWSLFGHELFAALVDKTFDLGAWFYELLRKQEDFEPYCRPQCNIVVFRYLPSTLEGASPERIDQFQSRLRQTVIRSGEYYLVPSTLDSRSYLRTTIINPLTTRAHLQGLLDCLRKHGGDA
jgi:L-2,4-diaminobutyrate decarboxylase